METGFSWLLLSHIRSFAPKLRELTDLERVTVDKSGLLSASGEEADG